jgi:predicted ester cyclase
VQKSGVFSFWEVPVSEEQNMAIVTEMLDVAWGKRDLAGMARYIAADHVAHGPMTDQLPPGLAGFQTFVTGMVTAFPDTQYSIDNQEAEGDLVRTWLTYHGTNTGSLAGMPPTGKQATVPVLETDRLENGVVVETWSEWDAQDLMRQLGG